MRYREQKVQLHHDSNKKLRVPQGVVTLISLKYTINSHIATHAAMMSTTSDGSATPNTRNRTHIPNVSQDEAHNIAGVSMKSQHKTLPDSFGERNGWILAQ